MNSLQKAGRLGYRLLKIAVENPKRLSYVFGCALVASDAVADRSCDLVRLPCVQFNDLLADTGDPWIMKLAVFPKSYASISVTEMVSLLLLIKQAKARNVFEFGTYKGISVTQFALNLPVESLICTLDLPEGTTDIKFAITDPDETAIALEGAKGSLVPPELKPRITFLKQDSATLDASAYAGRMDFVFVDGAHSYDYVKNDSEKGWQMLRSGGIIAWHDCRPQDPDVVRYLLECSFKPGLILDTTLAFAKKP